jgi:hypothetical protein
MNSRTSIIFSRKSRLVFAGAFAAAKTITSEGSTELRKVDGNNLNLEN